MDDVLDQDLRKLVASYAGLRVEAADLAGTDDLYDSGMTSTANVNLMLALEDEYDIEFPEEMLVRETFESLDAIKRSIERIRSTGGDGDGSAWM